MGAAYRAKYCEYLAQSQEDTKETNEDINIQSYHDFILPFIPNHVELVCEPSKDSADIYTPMLDRYRAMANVLQQNK